MSAAVFQFGLRVFSRAAAAVTFTFGLAMTAAYLRFGIAVSAANSQYGLTMTAAVFQFGLRVFCEGRPEAPGVAAALGCSQQLPLGWRRADPWLSVWGVWHAPCRGDRRRSW